MDWSLKDWKKEDELYSPKRKINNRGSQFHPHIIGSFFSQRNQSTVEFESLSERMFYYYLELDFSVARYYFQPVKVPVFVGKEKWDHIPDTLVFRQGSRPLLYQVKLEEEVTEKFNKINQACEDFACDQGWEYHVIYPKSMPEPIPRNIRFLKGFLKERFYYQIWYEPAIRRLRNLEIASVNVLAESFSNIADPLFIKPLVFHLIAKGIFFVNVHEKITAESEVTLNTTFNQIVTLVNGEERHVI